MPRLIDVWRAVDPGARLILGQPSNSEVLVRAVTRTRATAPHLPPPAGENLLVVDGGLFAALGPDRLVAELTAAGHEPAAVLLAGAADGADGADWPDASYPILASERSASELATAAAAYLADETGILTRLRTDLRLAAAEVALAEPSPPAPAGLVAHRIRRGVAVSVDGALVALHPRPAGRALAARFGAAFSRLFAAPGARSTHSRQLPDGLWIHEQRIRPGASVWLFDDLPMARVDMAAADALAITLRALLRRGSPQAASPPASPSRRHGAATPARIPPHAPAEHPWASTLLAVARANGRVAPAARSLGVHRNTVLYRLRVTREQQGIDPRRPEDALRLLREADRSH